MAIARWWKIDFHTHTPASQCFVDKSVSALDWVEAAINSGLDAVVVCDHNSGLWIEDIRAAAKKVNEDNKEKNLIIYPGVELCVTLDFIHVIIIFDPGEKSSVVRNFITECGIKDVDLGNTLIQVSEDKLSQLIQTYNVLVVPAHFTGCRCPSYLTATCLQHMTAQIAQ